MDDATEDPEHSAPGANSTLDPAASTRQTAGSERLVQQVLARRQAAFHGPDREPWRRDVQGGGARAAVFGVSDGLVSNVSLILGFAGAMPQPGVVRLAGIAGLLAGACSMAAGEYVSMRAQTKLFERELSIEAAQITHDPTRDERQLVEIFTARGVEPPTAVELARELSATPELALETHAREELGIDPGSLGSAWSAAWLSFASFVVGALVPLLPWFLVAGTGAVVWSVLLAAVSALLIGGTLARFTGRSMLRSALRQLIVAVLAGAATYSVGALLGVSVT
jgi:VIT1/CCC1 family predicted Fe2+/Mn2+ transporter